MSERTYYVICEDNCRFVSMTKEQIYAAIESATGNVPTSVDDAFITQLKEQNGNRNLKTWVGTQAQYNALANHDNNTMYIITDDATIEELQAELAVMAEELDKKWELQADEDTKHRISTEGTIAPILLDHGEIKLTNVDTSKAKVIVQEWYYDPLRNEVSFFIQLSVYNLPAGAYKAATMEADYTPISRIFPCACVPNHKYHQSHIMAMIDGANSTGDLILSLPEGITYSSGRAFYITGSYRVLQG